MKISRKWAGLVPVTVLSLTLAACGGSGGTGGGSQPNAAPPQSAKQNSINAVPREQLKSGGTFTWAVTQVPDNYNLNQLDGNLQDGANIMYALEPQSFYTDAGGTPYVNKDLLTDAKLTSTNPTEVVTYTINPKATWSDGTKITANDYIQQWKALNGSNAKYQTAGTSGYDSVGSVVQGKDDHEVVVTFKKKFSEWQSLFSPLFPASLNSDPTKFNTAWLQKPLVTAGPFKWGSLDKTAKTITLVRDDSWWGNKAILDKLVFRAIANDAQISSLASGEVDTIDIGPDADKYGRAKSIQTVQILTAGGPQFRHIDFNGATEALKDVNVRRALAMSLDRNRIAAASLGPLGVPATPLQNHILMPNQTGYQDNSGQYGKFDPATAKTMLDQAGWTLPAGATYRQKNGKELDLTFVIPSAVSVSEQEAKQTQSMLKEVGVKININTVPSDDFFTKYIKTGNWDMTVFSWINSAFPISSAPTVYGSVKGDNTQSNYGRIGDPKIDDLFAQATAEFDQTRKLQLANQADALVWNEAHSDTLYARPELEAVKKGVANFGAFGFASVIYENIGLTK